MANLGSRCRDFIAFIPETRMTTPVLRPIQSEEIPRLAISMSKAFFNDPMMEYLLTDENSRQKATIWMFETLGAYCRKWGGVFTDETLSGGSVWLSPGNTTMPPLRILLAGMWQMPFKFGLRGFMRFNKLDAMASKVHKKHMPGDHWYLLGLGTDPDQQGTGIGTAAIEIGAAKAQEAGLPVYLETMAESNVPYYEKRDFKVVEESAVDDELRIWSMVRNPS